MLTEQQQGRVRLAFHCQLCPYREDLLFTEYVLQPKAVLGVQRSPQ